MVAMATIKNNNFFIFLPTMSRKKYISNYVFNNGTCDTKVIW